MKLVKDVASHFYRFPKERIIKYQEVAIDLLLPLCIILFANLSSCFSMFSFIIFSEVIVFRPEPSSMLLTKIIDSAWNRVISDLRLLL